MVNIYNLVQQTSADQIIKDSLEGFANLISKALPQNYVETAKTLGIDSVFGGLFFFTIFFFLFFSLFFYGFKRIFENENRLSTLISAVLSLIVTFYIGKYLDLILFSVIAITFLLLVVISIKLSKSYGGIAINGLIILSMILSAFTVYYLRKIFQINLLDPGTLILYALFTAIYYYLIKGIIAGTKAAAELIASSLKEALSTAKELEKDIEKSVKEGYIPKNEGEYLKSKIKKLEISLKDTKESVEELKKEIDKYINKFNEEIIHSFEKNVSEYLINYFDELEEIKNKLISKNFEFKYNLKNDLEAIKNLLDDIKKDIEKLKQQLPTEERKPITSDISKYMRQIENYINRIKTGLDYVYDVLENRAGNKKGSKRLLYAAERIVEKMKNKTSEFKERLDKFYSELEDLENRKGINVIKIYKELLDALNTFYNIVQKQKSRRFIVRKKRLRERLMGIYNKFEELVRDYEDVDKDQSRNNTLKHMLQAIKDEINSLDKSKRNSISGNSGNVGGNDEYYNCEVCA